MLPDDIDAYLERQLEEARVNLWECACNAGAARKADAVTAIAFWDDQYKAAQGDYVEIALVILKRGRS